VYSGRFDHCNYIWRWVRIRKIFIVQFSPSLSCSSSYGSSASCCRTICVYFNIPGGYGNGNDFELYFQYKQVEYWSCHLLSRLGVSRGLPRYLQENSSIVTWNRPRLLVFKSLHSFSSFLVSYSMTLSISRLCSDDDRMVNEYRIFGGIKIGKENRWFRRTSTPVPLCPHDMTWGRTRFTAVEIFQGAQRSAVTRLSNSCVYTIIQNCVGNKQKTYKIMRMNMFAV
jgi:hypothetical protein